MSRCPDVDCFDDLCHGSGYCLQTGHPMPERCSICGEVVVPEYGERCACEREEEDFG